MWLAVSHCVQCWQRKLELWKTAVNLVGRGGGLRPCSSIYSPPGLVWCYFGSGRPEEAEYLVPEANIRLRLVGKHPLGWRGRGHLSVAGVLWHTWLVPLSRSVPLYLSISPTIVVQQGLLASDSSCVLTACSVPPDTRYKTAGIR